MGHHYVPQFLLRAWAETTADGKVEVFRLDLPNLPRSRRAPKHTGYEDDLYALTHPRVAGMEKHAVEKYVLRHIDNLAAPVMRKLEVQGLKSLTLKERADWVWFLMSLRIRQPDVIFHLLNESASHLRQTLAEQPEEYEALAHNEEAPTLEAWTEQHFPGLIENFGLSFFHKLVSDPKIGDTIFRMKWWLWDFGSVELELLLADHPCIFTRSINDDALVIALPISPMKAFLATRSNKTVNIMRRQKPKQLATLLNESSLGQAHFRVYGRGNSSERFIRNRLARRTR